MHESAREDTICGIPTREKADRLVLLFESGGCTARVIEVGETFKVHAVCPGLDEESDVGNETQESSQAEA